MSRLGGGWLKGGCMWVLGAAMLAASSQAGTYSPIPAGLTAREASDGWILLCDGQTTFGWNITGHATAMDGALILGGENKTVARTTTEFAAHELTFEHQGDEAMLYRGQRVAAIPSVSSNHANEFATFALTVDSQANKKDNATPARAAISISVPAGHRLVLKNFKLRPLHLRSIFNGKDLQGWTVLPDKKSLYSVTAQGELNVTNGPGDIQSEGQYADFVLQLDILSGGKHLNSGVFFRCIPGQFWSGYESQIRNQWEGDNRAKPVDFGTGGIYRRQPARFVIPNDGTYFTKTIIAHGNHMAVWVNGYQVSDFTDTRPAHISARQGTKTAAGPISLQGHDPTTNLSFRNVRIAELPPQAAK